MTATPDMLIGNDDGGSNSGGSSSGGGMMHTNPSTSSGVMVSLRGILDGLIALVATAGGIYVTLIGIGLFVSWIDPTLINDDSDISTMDLSNAAMDMSQSIEDRQQEDIREDYANQKKGEIIEFFNRRPETIPYIRTVDDYVVVAERKDFFDPLAMHVLNITRAFVAERAQEIIDLFHEIPKEAKSIKTLRDYAKWSLDNVVECGANCQYEYVSGEGWYSIHTIQMPNQEGVREYLDTYVWPDRDGKIIQCPDKAGTFAWIKGNVPGAEDDEHLNEILMNRK